jgi:hypothetical protein
MVSTLTNGYFSPTINKLQKYELDKHKYVVSIHKTVKLYQAINRLQKLFRATQQYGFGIKDCTICPTIHGLLKGTICRTINRLNGLLATALARWLMCCLPLAQYPSMMFPLARCNRLANQRLKLVAQ